MMELSKLSLKELRALQQQVQEQILKSKDEEIAKAREQILAIAQAVGIPLKDLMGTQRVAKKADAVKNKVAARYSHPQNQNLKWTGRGRQPKWVSEWVGSGKPLDALLIKSE